MLVRLESLPDALLTVFRQDSWPMQYSPAAVVGLTIAEVDDDDEEALLVPARDDRGSWDGVVSGTGAEGWRVSSVVAQVGTRATKNSRTRSD